MKTAETLKLELAQLPVAERAALAYFLLQSLDDLSDSDAESLWDAELSERVRDIKTVAASGEPYASVISRLREKYA
jgi:hypothetical protein